MAFAGTYTAERAVDLSTRVARLDRLSQLLDIAFVVPGTQLRFGIDAIMGWEQEQCEIVR